LAGAKRILSLLVQEPPASVPSRPTLPPRPPLSRRRSFSGLFSHMGTAAGFVFCACPSFTLPLSCTPWLHGSYPASQLLWVLRLLPARPFDRLNHGQVSLIHVPKLPTIPLPNTRHAPDIALTRYPSAVRLPSRVFRPFGSELRHSRAGSPTYQAESNSHWRA